MSKRLFLIAILSTMMSWSVKAATEIVDGITWTYTIKDGAASVGTGSWGDTAISKSTTGAVAIPSALGGYPVTSIGECAFYECIGLTSVTIPSSVTSIENWAFCCCSGLTSVTIPSSVTSIGSIAFSGCDGLRDVTVPGWKCGIDFSTVTNLVISEGTTSIKDYAFNYNMHGLTNVTIPNSVTNIGASAFAGCSGLTHITIPSSVTSIGNYAFEDCSGLTNVTIPEGVTSIENGAFYKCSGLTSVMIPSSVTNIGSIAFSRCIGLTSITIPSSVTSIENWAFSNCNGLGDVTVPGWGCEIDFSTVTNLVISDGTTSIRDFAFSNCSGLTSVTIPNSVTNIGAKAFNGCSGLTSVTIPEGVASIGSRAFNGCRGLMSFSVVVDNPNYKSENNLLLTKNGKRLVAGVNGDVTVPSSVTSVDTGAFAGCSGLTSVTFECDAPMTGDGIFEGTPSDMVVHVKGNSSGWTQWNGRVIRFDADSGSGTSTTSVNVNMTITNVIVHYIQTSELSPMAAPITKDVGIVNVMTEIKGGNISIPESWATNWPSFKATFGSDFSVALIRETGKFDAGGKPMYVWQDYVAGTDPTDKDDVFKASVTMVGDVPVVSYTPELSAEEKAKRKYTTWGKAKLQDKDWVEVSAGSEADYNFFKVTVEMR